jgi:hypothetical protein
MIEYKFKEEKEFILHYARKLNNVKIEQIISKNQVSSSAEASALAKFFWEMVDEIVKDKAQKAVVAGQTDLDAWNEYVFDSIRAYLRNNGYASEWDAQV